MSHRVRFYVHVHAHVYVSNLRKLPSEHDPPAARNLLPAPDEAPRGESDHAEQVKTTRCARFTLNAPHGAASLQRLGRVEVARFVASSMNPVREPGRGGFSQLGHDTIESWLCNVQAAARSV